MHVLRCVSVLSLSAWFLSACGSDDEPAAAVVMVIDDGFDITNPVLKSATLASFTMKCSNVPAMQIEATDDLATRRRKALQRLQSDMNACRLEKGLSPKSPP